MVKYLELGKANNNRFLATGNAVAFQQGKASRPSQKRQRVGENIQVLEI